MHNRDRGLLVDTELPHDPIDVVLLDVDVRWTPYTAVDIYGRAPSGLSSLCLRDHEYWMTRKPILYDIHIEEYHINWVIRKFGVYQ